ncbi:tRNA (adenine(37)-N6)-methyltransferase [Chlorella vulgaris]
MWNWPASIAAAVLCALQYRRMAKTEADLQRAEEQARFATEERKAERAGRVKAEKELRQLQLRMGQLDSLSATPPLALLAQSQQYEDAQQQLEQQQPEQQQQARTSDGLDLQQVAFPLRPVGLMRSCFSRRNGTPRQPLLVPAARARLTLRKGLSPDFFEGLQQYSHCWVLYIFHQNTDLQRLVPRLDGGKLGVFATRSPHRPCPIGLSVARVVAIEGRSLVLEGADIVDGSPVLDIKPFVPFCDNVPTAAAPAWVAAKAEDEPLNIGALRIPPAAEAAMLRCWQRLGKRSLYRNFEQYKELVAQVLSRDIRSVTQRIKVPQRAQHGGPAALGTSGSVQQPQQQDTAPAASAAGTEEEGGYWKVVLDGIQLGYDVEPDSRDVVLLSARLATASDE